MPRIVRYLDRSKLSRVEYFSLEMWRRYFVFLSSIFFFSVRIVRRKQPLIILLEHRAH